MKDSTRKLILLAHKPSWREQMFVIFIFAAGKKEKPDLDSASDGDLWKT